MCIICKRKLCRIYDYLGERLKFETDRDNYSKEVQRIYDETQTYHDGKWLMFEPIDTTLFDDFIRLLRIKRKPNRK